MRTKGHRDNAMYNTSMLAGVQAQGGPGTGNAEHHTTEIYTWIFGILVYAYLHPLYIIYLLQLQGII